MNGCVTIAYFRRSCDEKAKQIQSIPKQQEWCEEAANRLGIKVAETFTDTQSAKTPGRPEFNRMILFIENSSKPVHILTWRISRLARNPIDEGSVKYAFIQGKIHHICAGDREYNQGANQILMGVDFGEATQKSLDLSKDVTEGMQKKVKKGWRPGYAALGYLNDPHSLKGERKIFNDPERWDKVKKAWEMLLSGAYSMSEIKQWLDDAGFRTRQGKKIALSTLYSHIFTNIFYAGYYYWNGNFEQGKHTPMISLNDFDRAQFILGRKGQPRKKKHDHAFTGLIRCAECGCMITEEPPKYKHNRKTGTVRTYQYMRCTKKNPNKMCEQRYIRTEVLESQIDTILETIEIPEAFYRWAIDELKNENDSRISEFVIQRAKIQREYNENEAMIENLTDKLVRNVISEEIYQTSLRRYETKQQELKKEIAKYVQSKCGWLEKFEKDFHFAATARKRFEKGDLKTKRQIFSDLGSNFFLRDGKVTLELEKTLSAIKKGKEAVNAQLSRIEPPEYDLDKGKNKPSKDLIPVWSTWLNVTRTFLSNIIK
jgi:site-specific DNA recombinase